MFTALTFTSATVVALEREAVEQVSMDGDASGQRECVVLVTFTPGPEENPLCGGFRHRNNQDRSRQRHRPQLA